MRLLRLAQEGDCYLRILFGVGDHIMRGDPIVEVYGTNNVEPKEILAQFVVGDERDLFQDPAFGFRQLVDIASHALAGGVNLPSIAVMVIDNLTELLLADLPPPRAQRLLRGQRGTDTPAAAVAILGRIR